MPGHFTQTKVSANMQKQQKINPLPPYHFKRRGVKKKVSRYTQINYILKTGSELSPLVFVGFQLLRVFKYLLRYSTALYLFFVSCLSKRRKLALPNIESWVWVKLTENFRLGDGRFQRFFATGPSSSTDFRLT